MKETIVTVLITSSAAKKSAKTWQNATFAVMSGMTKWKPIVVGGIFTIASEIGSFNLTYTRQLKLAELREARINIRQDRV